MSQAFAGYGLFVELGTNVSPFVLTAIAEVQQVNFTGSKVDLVDVTHAQSPNARREFIATLIDSGTMDFTANYLPHDATQALLQSVMDSRGVYPWRVILPASLGEFDFNAIVTSIDHGLPFDKEAKLTVKVKITGPLNYSA